MSISKQREEELKNKIEDALFESIDSIYEVRVSYVIDTVYNELWEEFKDDS